jgi:hypothetical protein
MLDPTQCRRSEFCGGVPVSLADNQIWFIPAAPAPGAELDSQFGPAYGALLRSIAEAEDAAERSRAELALAIFLLRFNYDLTPENLQAILLFPSGTAAARHAQSTFHRVATRHLQNFAESARALRPDTPRPTRSLARAALDVLRGLRPARFGVRIPIKSS